jgi:HEAT repeat protein
MLATGDPPRRVEAVIELGKIRHRTVVQPILQTALNDHQSQVRIAATDALAMPGLLDEKELRSLTFLLSATDPEVRMAACRSLGAIRPPVAVDPLIQALYDREASVRIAAADALSLFGPAIVTRLTGLFGAASAEQKVSIAPILAKSKDPSYADLLTSALQDPDDLVRRACADAIGQIGITSAVPALVALARVPLSAARIDEFRLRINQRPTEWDFDAMVKLLDEDRVRGGQRPDSTAHGWLRNGNAYTGTFKRVLVQQQRDAANFVRATALKAILDVAPSDLNAVLIGMLGEQDEDIGTAVARVLRERGDAARPALVAAAQDTRLPATARCRIVDILTPPPPPPKRADTDRLRSLLRGMAETGDVRGVTPDEEPVRPAEVVQFSPDLLSLLTKLLADPDPNLRAASAAQLGRAGVQESVGPLIEAFRRADSNMMSRVASALAVFKDDRIAPLLAAALQDPRYAPAQSAIVTTLGAIGDRRATPALLRTAIEGNNLPIQLLAMDALAGVRDPAATGPMVEWFRKLLARHRDIQTTQPPTDSQELEQFRSRAWATVQLVQRAVSYFGAVKAREAVDAVLPLMDEAKGKYGGLAEPAMRALGQIGDPRAIGPIAELVARGGAYHDRVYVNHVTKAGIDALVAIGDPAAIPVLKKSAVKWNDPKDPFTGKYAIEAMGRLKHTDAVATLIQYLTDPAIDQAMKDSCVGPALASAGVVAKEALFRLVRESPKPPERATSDPGMYAAQILAVMEKPDVNVVPDFNRLLEGKPAPHVAQRATEGLAQTHHESAVQALAARVKDADTPVRQLAALALGSIKLPGAIPALQGALKDPDAKVRECAAYSLRAYGVASDATKGGNSAP